VQVSLQEGLDVGSSTLDVLYARLWAWSPHEWAHLICDMYVAINLTITDGIRGHHEDS
jgi:hypothetical protein